MRGTRTEGESEHEPTAVMTQGNTRVGKQRQLSHVRMLGHVNWLLIVTGDLCSDNAELIA